MIEQSLYARATDSFAPNDEPLVRRDFETLMRIHEEREDMKLREFAAAAFPEGGTPEGLRGHLDYHLARLAVAKASEQAEKARKEMYEAVQAKIVEQGVAGVFGAFKILFIIGIGLALLKLGISLPPWIKF